MKEFRKFNVAGVRFSMETDAQETLEKYIASLREAYKGQSGCDEIIADIEARIAELILSAVSSTEQVIAKPLVDNIIRQMGSADDISGEKTEPKPEASIPRRLYRDGINMKIGGVCSGVARYFRMDASVVRIVFFIPLLLAIFLPSWYRIDDFCGNVFMAEVLVYLLMWFAVPKAVTARQKMEMNGEPITSARIAGYESESEDGKAQHSVARFISALGYIGIAILKIAAVLVLFPLILFLIAMIAAGIAILVGFSFAIPGLPDITGILDPSTQILGIASVVIPVIAVCYIFFSLVVTRKTKGRVLGALFVVWIIIVSFLTVRIARTHVDNDWIDINDIIKHTVTEMADPSLDESSLEMDAADSISYLEAIRAQDAASIDR